MSENETLDEAIEIEEKEVVAVKSEKNHYVPNSVLLPEVIRAKELRLHYK